MESSTISSKWGMRIQTTDELLQAILSNLESQQDLSSQKQIIDLNNDITVAIKQTTTDVDTDTLLRRSNLFPTNLTNDSHNITSFASSETLSSGVTSIPSAPFRSTPLVTQYSINDSQVCSFSSNFLSNINFPLSVSIFSYKSSNSDCSRKSY
jgi:hypothetical protein